MPNRKPLLLLSMALGVAVALLGAFSALQCARSVDVVAALAGAFGAGASASVLVMERRTSRP
jgi:hypothetical protein